MLKLKNKVKMLIKPQGRDTDEYLSYTIENA